MHDQHLNWRFSTRCSSDQVDCSNTTVEVQLSKTYSSRFRYADGVVCNKKTFINQIVFEINQDDKDKVTTTNEEDSIGEGDDSIGEGGDSIDTNAHSQHNEQMVGLWHEEQQAMLGLEFYTKVFGAQSASFGQG